MSYRSHWTTVPSLSVQTMPANQVPGAVDDVGNDDVLVLFDHGNQEAFVLEGTIDAWEQLASLIKARCEFYRKGIGRSVDPHHCDGPECPEHGAAADNARQSAFYAENPRTEARD